MKNNNIRLGTGELVETNATLLDDGPQDICQRGNPSDPAYDPEHDWRLLGDYDGICFYRCAKCGKERQS